MKVFLILVLAFSFSSLALGQAKNDSSNQVPDDELVLRDLANRWLQADAKRDVPTVNILLADEFSFLGGNDRAQYLASMNPDPTLIVESAVVEDQKVQIYGETAIVTGLNSYKFKKDGRPIQAKFPALTVWVKKSGRWQCVKACTLPALTN
jgi:ketosteroid isomerase-like protein